MQKTKQKKVICFFCDEDYSNSKQSGGAIFVITPICPQCYGELLNYNSDTNVRAECPDNQSFADFIRENQAAIYNY